MINVDGSDTATPITWGPAGGPSDRIDFASQYDAKAAERSGLHVFPHRQDGSVADVDWQGYSMAHRGIAPVDVRQVRHDTAGFGATTALLDPDPAPVEVPIEGTLSAETVAANRAVLRNASERVSSFAITTDTPAQTTLTTYEFTQGC